MTTHHLAKLAHPETLALSTGLVDPKPARPKLLSMLSKLGIGDAEVMSSAIVRISEFATSSKGDAVLVKLNSGAVSAGRLVAIFSVAGHSLVLVNVWTLKSKDPHGTVAEWSDTHMPTVKHVQDVVASLVHTSVSDAWRTLIPFQARGHI